MALSLRPRFLASTIIISLWELKLPVGRLKTGTPPRLDGNSIDFSILEALQNAAKYSGASKVDVRLGRTNGRLTFEVVDDGRGFDPEGTSFGTGLQGIADRLRALDGTLEVRSAPGASAERDLTWLDMSIWPVLSGDGKLVLFSDRPMGAEGHIEYRISMDDPAPWLAARAIRSWRSFRLPD